MSASALLNALDDSGDELGQVLAVLRAAGVEDPGALALGDGDRRLLETLREATGSQLELTAACPRCETLNSVVVSPATVPPAAPRVARLGRGGGLREPTYADLLELPDDEQAAARELLRRCVVGSPSEEPSGAALELVDDALTGPVVLACAGCGQPLEVEVDVQKAVLHRLAQHALTVDTEVHLLARAYHWSLAEIDALPAARRAALARLVAEGV